MAPNVDVPQWSFVVDVWGLTVFLRGFLEDLHVQSLPGDHPLQLSVLFLQNFECHGHLRLHATNLLTPAVIGLFCDPDQLKLFRNFLPLAKLYIRATQLGNDLIHTVTFLRLL